ncbi:hypothetical protein [Pelagicoccus sp. SDUM812005]|uniref:hypothetical protein n=1 Tax=Pelagicoccus sp. SDUM812005 TaxID=3041257 RepID=UPI00280CFBAA|nr:hypothetical protein [Pelagicoccus sp. SDUM812005]MDQ8183853.1 hypothetical protein [Pelagicoccus sp. SDUM812005]
MQIKIIATLLLLFPALGLSMPKSEMNEQMIEAYENGILSGLRKEIKFEQFKSTLLDPIENRKNEKKFGSIYPALKGFIDHYQEGYQIWEYWFELIGPGTGRSGFVIVSDGRVIHWLELSID